MHYQSSSQNPEAKNTISDNKNECFHEDPVQRVIIPQGLVNPSQATVIEIPYSFQDRPMVIAKPKVNVALNKQLPVENPKKLYPTDNTFVITPYNSSRTRPVIETTRLIKEAPFEEKLNIKETQFLKNQEMQLPRVQNRNIYVYRNFNKDLKAEKHNIVPRKAAEEGDTNYLHPEKGDAVRDSFKDHSFNHSNYPKYEGLERHLKVANSTNQFTKERNLPQFTKPQCTTKKILYKRDSEEDLKDVLDNLDLIETIRIQRELKQFQKSRRKSIYEAVNSKL